MVDHGLLAAGYSVSGYILLVEKHQSSVLTARHLQSFMLDDCYSLRKRDNNGKIVEGEAFNLCMSDTAPGRHAYTSHSPKIPRSSHTA
jgi:hypothetical protein